MNQTSPTNDLRKPSPGDLSGNGDHLDQLFSDYFKSKMSHPWPKAPATPARMPVSEPSVLVGTRNSVSAAIELPRNVSAGSLTQQETPRATARSGGNKSRYTLALSVAVLAGSCWCLSNSFQPSEGVSTVTNAPPKVLGVFPDSTAEKPAALEKLKQDNAEHGDNKAAKNDSIFLK